MKYPEKRVFPGSSHFLLHICDPLLIHDQVLIRSDSWTLQFLYSKFSCQEIEPLLSEGNIKFFAAINEASNARPYINANEGSIDQDYLRYLYECFSAFSGTTVISKASEIVRQIEKYSVAQQAIDSESCKSLQDNLFTEFMEKGGKNLPVDRSKPFYHEDGFQKGIGRIFDIWSKSVTYV